MVSLDGEVDSSPPEHQERAVGITAFASPKVPGFSCTIKHRYTDFLVNEISPSGQVLHLDDLGGKSITRRQVQDHAEPTNDTLKTSSDGPTPQLESLSSKRELEPADDAGEDQDTTPRKKAKFDETDRETSTALTADPAMQLQDTSLNARIQEIVSNVPVVDKTSLHNIFGAEVTDRILPLYANVTLHPDRKPCNHLFIRSNIISDKSNRTAAHVAIRRIFSSKLQTETLQDQPGVICIKAAPTKGPSGARGQPNVDGATGGYQKGKLGWSELGGEYLHFTLYKENKDTMEVLYFIASRLKVHVKNFQFAGTKDRRAVTVQRVAIFRVHSQRVMELNKSARGWKAGNFEYKKHGLELGELGGNEFLLTLRDCHFKGEESLLHDQKVVLARKVLEVATESFKRSGFLNYYGLQRFGSFSTGTHVIGQKMLSGDLGGAVSSILAYSEALLDDVQNGTEKRVPQDDIDRAKAIELWREGEPSDAVKKMPKRFQAEAAIIQYLGKKDRKTGQLVQDRDWQGALTQIQRNLRLMYVHAYQSLVWNTMVGKRWELFGNKVVEGDLVIVGEKGGEDLGSKDEVDEDGEPIFHPAADDSAPSTEEAFTRARLLGREEAESGKYDIFDVVLPQPGYDVLYPANAVGRFYEDFMASDAGGRIDPNNMRRSWKDVSLSGAYRKIMARPGPGFGFEVKSYVGDEEQMVETDLEKLRKQTDVSPNEDVEVRNSLEVKPNGGDKKIAVVLKLQLGSSQYATMALRELTKGASLNYKPDYSSR